MKKIDKNTEYDNCMDINSSRRNPLAELLEINDEDESEEWKKYWKEMPEFVQENNESFKKIIVHFRNDEDYKAFSKLIEQHLTEKTKSIWFPAREKDDNLLKRWIEDDKSC